MPVLDKPPVAPNRVSIQPQQTTSLRANRSFTFLWLAQVVSQLADRIVFVVFVALIVQQYGSNDSYTSFLYIAFTIPAILLTAVAGVFVDRWPRRLVLVSTNILRAAFCLSIPWALASGLWGIYGLAFLLSAATQFFVPAEAATIPTIVPKGQLLKANSLFTTTMMASVIFGFALGDPLINALSLPQVHWALFGLFALAAVLLAGVHIPTSQPVSQTDKPSTLKQGINTFIAELKEGIDYIKHQPLIWQAMMKLALLFSTIVATCILSISFAKEYLYEDPTLAAQKFAYIVAMSGVGMAIGAGLVSKPLANAPRSLLVFGGMGITGLALLALTLVTAVSPELHTLAWQVPPFDLFGQTIAPLPMTVRMLFTYSMAALLGFGAAGISIPLQSLLHEQIPEDKRGKVLGVQFTLLSTSSTFPVIVAGLGSEWFGSMPMLVALAIPFVIWSTIGFGQKLSLPAAEA